VPLDRVAGELTEARATAMFESGYYLPDGVRCTPIHNAVNHAEFDLQKFAVAFRLWRGARCPRRVRDAPRCKAARDAVPSRSARGPRCGHFGRGP